MWMFSCEIYGILRRAVDRKRSSPPEVICKKGVLRKWQSLFFNKIAGLRQKKLWHRCFPLNFVNDY